ncbi:MAG: hypothetical protein GX810_09285, partial [Clostridiales bacterium]|nr:hypothetical protein [Clostridiales bacterium]
METNTATQAVAQAAISQNAITTIFVLAGLTIVAVFIYAAWLAKWVREQKNENKEIERIAGLIRSGANAFIRKEYTI